jgi:hypothetical protein
MRIQSCIAPLALLLALGSGCSGGDDGARESGGPVGASAEEAPVAAAEEDAGTATPAVVTDAAVPATGGASRSDAIIAAKRPYDESIPVAPRGRPEGNSILDRLDEDPYERDPERDAVRRGYRNVEPREVELEAPTFASADELAQEILDRIFFDHAEGLHELDLTKEEYLGICWSELPQSRPATNIPGIDSWLFHDANNRDGVREAIQTWGGQQLYLNRIEYEVGYLPFTNFDLYRGVVIHAVTEEGEDVRVDVVSSFIEAGGRWKVFMFKA